MASATEMLDRAEHSVRISRLQPLGDRVLLRRIPEPEGGEIKIADAFRPKSRYGEVLSVGEAVKNVFKGEEVFFSQYSANEIMVDGEELVVISERDIWLKL
jgi:chaperonin GroES